MNSHLKPAPRNCANYFRMWKQKRKTSFIDCWMHWPKKRTPSFNPQLIIRSERASLACGRSFTNNSSFSRFRSCLRQHIQIWARTLAMSSTKAITLVCGSWMWRQRPAAASSSPALDTPTKTAEKSSARWRPSTKLKNMDLHSPRSGTQTTHWHLKSLSRTNSSRASSWASTDPSHHNLGKLFKTSRSNPNVYIMDIIYSDSLVRHAFPSDIDDSLTNFRVPFLLCTNLEAKLDASRQLTHMSASAWTVMSTLTSQDLWSTLPALSATKDGSPVTSWLSTRKRASWLATTSPSATPLATLFSTQMCKFLKLRSSFRRPSLDLFSKFTNLFLLNVSLVIFNQRSFWQTLRFRASRADLPVNN